MSIVVTGATGQLGRLVVEALLRRGVPAGEVVAVGRSVEKIADLAERGVEVRRADYADPDALRAAFAGAGRVLFVSGNELGQRDAQGRAVVAAAQEAGATLVAYTSIPHADTSDLVLAQEHAATERALTGSGLPYSLLRNGWYLENYTDQLATTLERGLIGATGGGRISAAARADYAEAAAEVLTGEGHENTVYELGGEPVTLTELAAVISAESGREVRYTDLPAEDYVRALLDAGLPEPYARLLADSDRGAAQGALEVSPDDLTKLIGRAPTTATEAVRTALATLAPSS
jgi:NAD(P)H dehydrogenase (quinone)